MKTRKGIWLTFRLAKIIAEHIKSVLLGVAVGDALGVPATGDFKITGMTGNPCPAR